MKNGKAQTGGALAGFLKKNNIVLLMACGGVLLVLFASTLFGGSHLGDDQRSLSSRLIVDPRNLGFRVPT